MKARREATNDDTFPGTATGVVVSDPLPVGLTSFVWSGSNGHSGTGAISDTIASLAPGAGVTYTVTATVNPSATAQLVNTVTVTAANDTDTTNNRIEMRLICSPSYLGKLMMCRDYQSSAAWVSTIANSHSPILSGIAHLC